MKLAIVILAAFLVSACSGRTVRGVPASDPIVTTTTQGASSPEAPMPENSDQAANAGESTPATTGQSPVPNLDEELGDLDQILGDLDQAMAAMSAELNNTEGETTP